MKTRLAPFLAGLPFILAGCATGGAPASSSEATVMPPTSAPTLTTPSPTPVELTIYAAASLKGALEAAKPVYEAANPGTALTIATDASSALAAQIEQGAPADVFLSADTKNPQALVDKGLADGPLVDFADNDLTIVVPIGNPAGIAKPADLAKPGIKIIAAGDEVPITKYANQLIGNLAKEPGYPTDYAAKYRDNVVSKEDNVKAVLGKLELGEGDAAIVYVTDAKASTLVADIGGVPESANVIATYGGVVITESPNRRAATSFLTWLAGRDGQAILSGYGFQPPLP